MSELSAEIHMLLSNASQSAVLAADEYIDPSDGLIHCKSCGGRRQTVVPIRGITEHFTPLVAFVPVRQLQNSAARQPRNSVNASSASGAGVNMAYKTVTYTITPLPTTMGKIS